MSSRPDTSDAQPLITRWILNPRLDLLLFVGTPALIVPLFVAASQTWTDDSLFLVVSTFGALGHHAPGLMRAYGDKQLFRRFWMRFTLVPAAVLTLFLMIPLKDMPGVTLVIVTWGVWHFLMQTYGFARIYDAKIGSLDAITQRLDLALCIAWSGTCVLFAPSRLKEFLSLSLKTGANFVLDIPLDTVRTVWLGGTILVTLLFVSNIFRKAFQGQPVNVAKLVLFASTFAFFWYCAVTLTNLLIGVAMFELFHDVQYLAIVWLFNRNRVTRQADVGLFTRFLFRPGTGLLGAYFGLVIAYGFMGFAAERLTSDRLQHVLFAIVAASNVLHFYYDGFIWKIREPETSDALGVTSSRARVKVPGWFTHAAKWGVLVAIIACLLAAARSTTMTELQQAQAVAERLPGSTSALNAFAKELIEAGRYDDALRICDRAKSLEESRYRTHMYRGVALTAIGSSAAGFAELQRAHELNPHDAYLRFHLAMGCIRQRRYDDAVLHLEASVAIRPDDAVGQFNLGQLYLMTGKTESAIDCLEAATRLAADYPDAHRSLGEAYLKLRQPEKALEHLETSLRVDGNSAITRALRAAAYRQLGEDREANSGSP